MASLLNVPDLTRPLTVSQLNRLVKDDLESSFPEVGVQGEISNLRQPQSGHAYFTLKDRFSQVSAVMFRSAFRRAGTSLKDGMEVVVRGRLSVYEPRGSYQIVVASLKPVGRGVMDAALQKLVEKLSAEGLFDEARKRRLPFAPIRIAVVTSAGGAALRDIISTIRGRFPPARISVICVPVQGEEAPEAIARAIRAANREKDFEALIVARGGGSAEDLSAFNTEVVARAIYESRIPVVSAVGHEINLMVSDLVADVRARTPTHAGQLVVPDLSEVRLRLGQLMQGAVKRVAQSLENARYCLKMLAKGISPRLLVSRLDGERMRADDLLESAGLALGNLLEVRRAKCDALRQRLDSLSPFAVLARGYSVTLDEETGAVIMNSSVVRCSQSIVTRLAKGVLHSVVKGKTDDAKTVQKKP